MRRARGRAFTPAPQGLPQVCGPCGDRFGTVRELAAHQEVCLVPDVPAVSAVRMLANATLCLMDRLPTRRAGAVSSAIYRAATGLTVEQRARLAWLVDEFADCLPQEAGS